VGNTPPGTDRKTPGDETAEMRLPSTASATGRSQPQTPRLPRNEGVRGSNPLVGFSQVTGDEGVGGSGPTSRFGGHALMATSPEAMLGAPTVRSGNSRAIHSRATSLDRSVPSTLS